MKKSTVRTFMYFAVIVLVIACFPAILEMVAGIALAVLHGIAAVLILALVWGSFIALMEYAFGIKLYRKEATADQPVWQF